MSAVDGSPTPALVPAPVCFYETPAAALAPQLLGLWLVRRLPEGLCAARIVETEAYPAGDPASHAFRGKTRRNQSMFGPPGRAYLYFIYGNHWCFNVVCRPEGAGEAVLVRAVEPVLGEALLRARRSAAGENLCNGPAKLCAAFDLDRRHDGADLCDPAGAVWVAVPDHLAETTAAQGPVIVTTRIGLSRAAGAPFRFYLEASPWVSRRAKEKRAGKK